MWRVVVSEEGQASLPAIDVAETSFIIGSSPLARVRLPAVIAQPEHIRIENGHFIIVDGTSGDLGDGVTLTVGAYQLVISRAPEGSRASPPQRTESIARELMRNLLGTAVESAPSLAVEAGPVVGAVRTLGPPTISLVIGRGDEADWAIVDGDLSRRHAEIRRSWDGTRILDLESKNGTRVDGSPVPTTGDGMLLRSGARIELGKVVVRFTDPADVQLAAPAPVKTVVATPSARRDTPPSSPSRPSTLPFYAALGVMLAALTGLVVLLAL